jgi:hypothetical protein
MRYFKVIHSDVVTVLKSMGQTETADGKTMYDHLANTYAPDEVIPETEISPVVIESYDNEEDHIRGLLLECDENGQVGGGSNFQARKAPGRKPKEVERPMGQDEVKAEPSPFSGAFTDEAEVRGNKK